MPNRLTTGVVAAGAALAVAAFGGAYALGQGEPAAAPKGPTPPAEIALDEQPLAKLGEAAPLPGLAAPAPEPPKPAEPEPEEEPEEGGATAPPAAPAPVAPAPAPAPVPAPEPTPSPTPDPATPESFDDSG